jgi:hypothetical protein
MTDRFQDHGMVCVTCRVDLTWDAQAHRWGTFEKMGVHGAYVHPWGTEAGTHTHYPMPKGD